MINITGLDFNQVADYVASQYFRESSLADKMYEGGDAFSALDSIKPELDAFVQTLWDESSASTPMDIKFKLYQVVKRDD